MYFEVHSIRVLDPEGYSGARAKNKPLLLEKYEHLIPILSNSENFTTFRNVF